MFKEIYEKHGLNEKDFSIYQRDALEHAMLNDIDISKFADPKFTRGQMEILMFGVKDGIDVSSYANAELDEDEMYEMYRNLKNELDTRKESEAMRELTIEELKVLGEQKFIDNHETQALYFDDLSQEMKDKLQESKNKLEKGEKTMEKQNKKELEIIKGRLTADPVLKTSKDGKIYCTATLADNFKNEEGKWDVKFTNIVIFGDAAAKFASMKTKGSFTTAEGTMKESTYENKEKVVKTSKSFSVVKFGTLAGVKTPDAKLEEVKEAKATATKTTTKTTTKAKAKGVTA